VTSASRCFAAKKELAPVSQIAGRLSNAVIPGGALEDSDPVGWKLSST